MKSIRTILLFFLSLSAFAQQDGQFANIWQNAYVLNSGAGGLYDVAQFDATTRMQWLGYKEGPRSVFFSGHSQLRIAGTDGNAEFTKGDQLLFKQPSYSTGKMKHIVGGKAYYDGVGVFSKTGFQGSYAVHLPATKTTSFGLGLGFGLSNFSIDQDRVILHDQDDNTYQEFLSNSGQQNFADFNVGLVYYGKKFLIGLSSTQLFNNRVQFGSIATQSNFNRHYYLIAKYQVDFSENFSVEPLAVVKMVENAPASLDYGLRFSHNKTMWIGIMGRSLNTCVLQIGSNLVKNLYFSYSYETAVGKISNAASGSHEIQLGCYLGKRQKANTEKEEQ